MYKKFILASVILAFLCGTNKTMGMDEIDEQKKEGRGTKRKNMEEGEKSKRQKVTDLIETPNKNSLICSPIVEAIYAGTPYISFSHHEKEPINSGFSKYIITVHAPGNFQVEIDGVMEKFTGMFTGESDKTFYHQFKRCECVNPYNGCGHFQTKEEISPPCVSEFVEVFFEDTKNNKIQVNPRKFFRDHPYTSHKDYRVGEILESEGRFTRTKQQIEKFEVLLKQGTPQQRNFSFTKDVGQPFTEILTPRHVGFIDYWNNGYSQQRLNIFSSENVFITEKTSRIRIPHQISIVKDNHDGEGEHYTINNHHHSYGGVGNHLIYDNNNLLQTYMDPASHRSQRVNHTKNGLSATLPRGGVIGFFAGDKIVPGWKRDDGTTYYAGD